MPCRVSARLRLPAWYFCKRKHPVVNVQSGRDAMLMLHGKGCLCPIQKQKEVSEKWQRRLQRKTPPFSIRLKGSPLRGITKAPLPGGSPKRRSPLGWEAHLERRIRMRHLPVLQQAPQVSLGASFLQAGQADQAQKTRRPPMARMDFRSLI